MVLPIFDYCDVQYYGKVADRLTQMLLKGPSVWQLLLLLLLRLLIEDVSNKFLELVTRTTFTGISKVSNLPADCFPQTNPNSYQ